MINPIGYLIQAQNLPDRQALLYHLAKANPTTVSILDDYALCVQIKNLLPDCIVVHRDYNFEPAYGYSDNTFHSFLNNLPDKRIVLMVNCEQGFDSTRVTMWVRLMELAHDRGYRLCVGNASSGSVKCGQGDDPNEWLTIGSPLLDAFVTYPEHFLGFHEYTLPFAWGVSNGTYGDPQHPPNVLDWTKPQWHIGRNVQGIAAACAALKIAPPKCIVTEGVFDSMNDIVEHFGMKADGWKTLQLKWAEWYPLEHSGNVLADQHQWAWEKAYAPCGFVVGIHVFTWGSASDKWHNYRVDDNPKYLKRMEVYRPFAVGIPTPAPIPVPPVVLPPKPPETAQPTPRVLTMAQIMAFKAWREELQEAVDTYQARIVLIDSVLK